MLFVLVWRRVLDRVYFFTRLNKVTVASVNLYTNSLQKGMGGGAIGVGER